MTQFEYPLNPDWTTEEIIRVVDFLSGVEAVYQGVATLPSIQANSDQYWRRKATRSSFPVS